jgi:PIN domain nuclease of toxin-antitoxin system
MENRSLTTSAANRYVLDAHALLWYLLGSQRLGSDARSVMQDPNSVLYLPAIALAESCWAVERGRCAIPSVSALLADIDGDPRISIMPLDRAILDLSFSLTTIREMHDRQIVATALHLTGTGNPIRLLTCDTNIIASSLVPITW